ncbi:MAG: T9SS type A sorting domain-containing protein [Ignavibacteriae bacterium]|nr:T9SS type A sorting domain-containing protein [Ignavibacteriota bacterium]
MIQKVLFALVLTILVSGLLWGATDGKKQISTLLPANPDTSAPDAWGYTWVKSTEPGGPTFRWVDIATRGTRVTGLTDDNVVGPFNMLWDFSYYWYSSNRFKVGSNGYITFDNTTTAFAPSFAQLPATSLPNDLMAICVGDLVFSGQAGAAGDCFYWTNGTDSLVVSFINVTEWEQTINPNTKHTFQVILSKSDSSITYQYGLQQGRYNSTNNTRLCIGMENATGQIGLNYVYSTAPPHALLPDSGLVIKFKRTRNTGLQVTDGGIVGGFNSANLAKMVKVGVADTIKCLIKNFGTAAITNASVRYAISRTGQTTVYDTVVVPSLAPSQEMTVTFPRLFTPALTGSYTSLFTIVVTGDVGPGNNTKTAEIRSLDFGTTGSRTQLAFENGTQTSSTSWIGGGGYGYAFDLPADVYPVYVETVYVNIASITANPMIVQIMDGSTGIPGTILAEKTNVTAVVGWNAIPFTSDSVRVNGGRFFVGARGNMAFYYEGTAPLSYRTWEYTGGWAPYRSADLQDLHVRATVRRPGVVIPGHDIGVSSLVRTAANDAPAVLNPTIDVPDIANVVDLSSGEHITYVAMADTARFRAIVQNFGTFPETTYQVRFTVNGNTISTVNNGRILAVGGRDTFNLAWNAGTPGTHLAKAFTILGADNNRANDTSSASFTITSPGAQPGDTLYSFRITNQLLLGVAKIPSNKLVFTSGGQSNTLTTDNKWIATTMRGTILDTTKLQINNTSGQGFGFRDLAWDGRSLLTSDNAQLRRVDTVTYTELLPRITGPGALQRGVAWEMSNRIWKSNFTSDPVVKFDTTGATIKTLGVPTVAPYGIAFDKWTSRNRGYLWYAQPSTTGLYRLSKVDTATGAILTTYDYSTMFTTGGSSGGLDITNSHPDYPGRVVAFMVIQLGVPAGGIVVAIDLGRDSSQTSTTCNTFASQWSPPGRFPDTPDTTYFQAAAWLGDTLYVHAPTSAGAGSTRVWKYTYNGAWSTGVPLPSTKTGGTLTACAGKLYYIGGGVTAINGTASSEVVEFNPATQAWTIKAPMPVALAGHGAVNWGDSVIFVVGGPYSGSGTNLNVQVYRPASNSWSTIAASLPSAQGRRTFALGISGNKIIMSGGFNTAFLKTTWVGTINSASSITWAAAPDVPTIYAGLSRPGGIAYGDKFFIVCGERAGAGGYYDTTHVYSVSLNSWIAIIRNKPIRMSNIFNAVTAKCINDTVRVFVPGGYGNATGPTPGFGQRVFDVINGGSLTAVPELISNLPQAFNLEQNYPNPFNPMTTMRFTLPQAGFATLTVYNILGQRVAAVAEGQYEAGTYKVQWDASRFASGVYLYRLELGNYSQTKKMMLLK